MKFSCLWIINQCSVRNTIVTVHTALTETSYHEWNGRKEGEARLLAFSLGFSLQPLTKRLQEGNGRTGVGHSAPPNPSLFVKVEPDSLKMKGRCLPSETQGRTTKELVSMQTTGFPFQWRRFSNETGTRTLHSTPDPRGSPCTWNSRPTGLKGRIALICRLQFWRWKPNLHNPPDYHFRIRV